MQGRTTQQGGWQDARRDASSTGEITVITGCMFSGKTTRLLRELSERPPGLGLAFKPTIDDRYRKDAIVSHDGAAYRAVSIERASDIFEHVTLTSVRLIVIDEVHFLNESLVDVATDIACRGIDLFLAGLDLDSWGRPFPHMTRLASVATHVESRRARCARCGEPATRTQRTRPLVDNRLVGGAERYEPRCEPCWTPPPVSSDPVAIG
jgi:thymidine kinase